jgi:hypothetical protein
MALAPDGPVTAVEVRANAGGLTEVVKAAAFPCYKSSAQGVLRDVTGKTGANPARFRHCE